MQATLILEYCCLKTIFLLVLMCALGHCPAESSVPPLSSLVLESLVKSGFSPLKEVDHNHNWSTFFKDL